jgi:CRISPR-associated protein Csx10
VTEEHWLTLAPQTPLCISSHRSSRFISSRDEIPGSVLRGTFARYIKLEKGESHISEIVSKMRFGFFRPSNSKDLVSLPFPLTAQQCKKRPGFKKGEGRKEGGHGIFDFLIPFIAYEEIGGKTPWLLFDVPFNFTCNFGSDGEKCRFKMEQTRGYYSFEHREFRRVEVEHESQTKISIDRRTRTAKEGMLFSITGISPRVSFLGRVWGPEEYVSELEYALEQFGIGALTGRGFGIIAVKRNGRVRFGTVRERVERFNNTLLNVWKDLSSLAGVDNVLPESEATYFTVDLLSPAILRFPIPTIRLSLTIAGIEYEPIHWFTNPTFIGGWSPALGLPKSTCLGADIGSTYVFKSDLDMDTLIQNLEELETRGIGFRSEEGYGEIMICHPFHLEVTQI